MDSIWRERRVETKKGKLKTQKGKIGKTSEKQTVKERQKAYTCKGKRKLKQRHV